MDTGTDQHADSSSGQQAPRRGMSEHRGSAPHGAKRRGRRPSGEDTRAALLRAGLEVFTELGYDRATVRTIATRAGVDAAMVNHWFGGKEGLFVNAISLPVNPADLVEQGLDGDPDHIADRLVRHFLAVWDEAGGGEFVALVRSLATHEASAQMLREFIAQALFGKITRLLDVDQPDFRAALCASQIVGLGMVRYVVFLEPLATADHDTVVAAVAPNLQRYINGNLSGV